MCQINFLLNFGDRARLCSLLIFEARIFFKSPFESFFFFFMHIQSQEIKDKNSPHQPPEDQMVDP